MYDKIHYNKKKKKVKKKNLSIHREVAARGPRFGKKLAEIATTI